MFRHATICLVLLAEPISAMAVTKQGDLLGHQLERVAAKVPRSSSLLSVLADRKLSLAKQMAQLEAKYNATNSATYTDALKAAKKRLAKQQKECEDCEKAENALDMAYDKSLAAHKYVEDVDADLLKITEAEIAHGKAVTKWETAKEVLEKYNVEDFTDAKNAALDAMRPWTWDCDAPEKYVSEIGTFSPHFTDGDKYIKFDEDGRQGKIDDLNAAAKQLRYLQGEVFDAKKFMDKMKDELDAAKAASTYCKETTPSEEMYCTPADAASAKSKSGEEDKKVEEAIKNKDEECAAIDQVEWGTEAPTEAPTAAPTVPKAIYKEMGCIKSGSNHRVSDVGTASNGFAATFTACAKKCKNAGYPYFGLECPMSSGTHCQCYTDGDEHPGRQGRDWLSAPVEPGACQMQGSNNHCANAKYLKYEGHTYLLGGAYWGSVYSVEEQA
jgi:hypothetical protein